MGRAAGQALGERRLPGAAAREGQRLSEILRHEIQGAHLAQRRANRTNELGDQPLIRLLVANAGDEHNQWRPVVGQLLEMVRSERLVAVTGLGSSWETTQQTIVTLTAQDMPVVGARLAAVGGGQPGFVRLPPPSSDHVKAAVAHLKRDLRIQRALLVQDVNAGDPFTKALGEAFADEFPGAAHILLEPVERYDSSRGGLANRFVRMMASICLQRPDVVYFAGRGGELASFVEALPGRPCPDLPINLVTGGSGPSITAVLRSQLDGGEEMLKAGLEANVTLRYTSTAHPQAWATAPESFSPASVRYFQQSCQQCLRASFAASCSTTAGPSWVTTPS